MLRPLIVLFVNFYYNDLIGINILLGVAAFLYEFFVANTEWWHFLVQLPIALILSTLGRWPQRRLDSTSGGRPFMLLLRHRDDDWMWPLLVSFVLSVCTLGYNQRVHYPSMPVSGLFPIGMVRTMVIMFIVSLVVIECVGYYWAQPSCTFKLFGLHSLSRILTTLVCAVDMVAFSSGYAPVLTGLAMLIGLFLAGRLFKWLFAVSNKH